MPAPWYTPENADQAEDCLEHIADVTAFLADAFSQNTQDKFQFSKEGEYGLYYLLVLMETSMRLSLKQIGKRRKAP